MHGKVWTHWAEMGCICSKCQWTYDVYIFGQWQCIVDSHNVNYPTIMNFKPSSKKGVDLNSDFWIS